MQTAATYRIELHSRTMLHRAHPSRRADSGHSLQSERTPELRDKPVFRCGCANGGFLNIKSARERIKHAMLLSAAIAAIVCCGKECWTIQMLRIERGREPAQTGLAGLSHRKRRARKRVDEGYRSGQIWRTGTSSACRYPDSGTRQVTDSG